MECVGDVSELARRIRWVGVKRIFSTPRKGRRPTKQMGSVTGGQACKQNECGKQDGNRLVPPLEALRDM